MVYELSEYCVPATVVIVVEEYALEDVLLDDVVLDVPFDALVCMGPK